MKNWNLDDVCSKGVCSSYTERGVKIKFIPGDDGWMGYELYPFMSAKKTGKLLPEELEAFDEGNVKEMTKVAKRILGFPV